MYIDKDILDKHEQKYEKSCVPSAVEMILKLEGIIDPSSYHLQEKYGDNNPLSGDDFDKVSYPKGGKTIKFHKILLQTLPEIFEQIDNELRDGRCVLIPLKTSSYGEPWNCHIYIIYDFSHQGDYKTVTRFFRHKEAIYEENTRRRFTDNFNEMKDRPLKERLGTDFLIYERL